MSTLLFLTAVFSGALAIPVSSDVPPNTPPFLIPYAIAFRETVWHVCSYIKEGAQIIANYLPSSVNSFLGEAISVLSLFQKGTRNQLIVASIVFGFMCSWITAYPYIHYKSSGKSKMILFEACYTRMITGIIAPDAITMSLVRYYGTAAESLRLFNKAIFPEDTKNGWTIMHAYFSLLQGFELDNGDNTTLSELTLPELTTLILGKEVDLPDISEEDIRARTTGGSKKSTKWFVVVTYIWFALKFRCPQEFDLLRQLMMLYGYFTVYSGWISSGKPFTVVKPFRVIRKPKLKDQSEKAEKEKETEKETLLQEELSDSDGAPIYSSPDVDLEEAQPSSEEPHSLPAEGNVNRDGVVQEEERDKNNLELMLRDVVELCNTVVTDWQASRGVSGAFFFILSVTFVHIPSTAVMITISILGEIFIFTSIVFSSLLSPMHNIWDLMICPVVLPAVVGNAISCWLITFYWGILIRETRKVQFKTELEGRLWTLSTWFIVLQPVILVWFSTRRLRARFSTVLKKIILALYSLLYVVARFTVLFLAFYALRRV